MNRTLEHQLARIEEQARRQVPTCRTCWGNGPNTVWIPDGADPAAPEYNPQACPDCGAPTRRLVKVIGIDLCDAEAAFGPLPFQPRPEGCEERDT